MTSEKLKKGGWRYQKINNETLEKAEQVFFLQFLSAAITSLVHPNLGRLPFDRDSVAYLKRIGVKSYANCLMIYTALDFKVNEIISTPENRDKATKFLIDGSTKLNNQLSEIKRPLNPQELLIVKNFEDMGIKKSLELHFSDTGDSVNKGIAFRKNDVVPPSKGR